MNFLILSIFVSFFSSSLWSEESIVIKLKEFASINSSKNLSIKDVADVKCDEPIICNKINGLQVDVNSDYLSKYNIIKALGNIKNYRIIGRVTKILHNSGGEAKERLTAAIRDYVIAVCNIWHPKVELSLADFKEEVVEKNLTIDTSSFNCLSGNVLFSINNKNYIFADVKITGDVVRAAKDISQNQLLDKDNVVTERRLLSTPNLINKIEDVIGLRTRCRFTANSNINSTCLEINPVIANGDIVQLKVITNGVEISTPAKALQSGRIGELINLKSTVTNKVIQARVISKNNTEVNL